jgi:HEPN domain-containing protein
MHLSIEKALKGLYNHKLNEIPPKTHNLIYLVEKLGLNIPNDLYTFIFTINRISVPTRYPDNLKRTLEDYNKEKTGDVFQKSKVVLGWLKTQL